MSISSFSSASFPPERLDGLVLQLVDRTGPTLPNPVPTAGQGGAAGRGLGGTAQAQQVPQL